MSDGNTTTEIFFELTHIGGTPGLRVTCSTFSPGGGAFEDTHLIAIHKNHESFLMMEIEHAMRRHEHHVTSAYGLHSHFEFLDSMTVETYIQILDQMPCRLRIRNGFIMDLVSTSSAHILETPEEKAQRKLEKKMRKAVPGLDAVLDEVPCYCLDREGKSLMSHIIHLNDVHKWDRQQIGTYLAKLHDSGVVNLEFKIPAQKETA